MRFDSMFKWEKLNEIKGMSFEQFEKWLEVNGLEEAECNETKTCVWVDGFWADLSPIVEFQDGKVARWFRQECFE